MARLKAAEALPYLETAVRVKPDDAEARNLLGGALERTERSAEAADQFEAALRLRPDYENARLNLARTRARQGRFDDALEQYRKLLAEQPGDEAATAGLERALETRAARIDALGETVEAGKLYRELVQLDPANPAAHDALGECLLREGSYQQALDEFNAALRLEPANEAFERHRDEAASHQAPR